MAISSVIFDFGGVLLDWSPFYVYDEYFGSHARARHFIDSICTAEWNATMDAGTPFAEAVDRLSRIHPQYAREIRMYAERWPDMLRGPIEAGVQLLEELHASGRIPLYGLTNWSAETFPYARDRYPFLSYFRDIVVSGEVGLIKPDPEIYRLLLRRCQLQAEECLFIDDNGANILAARDLGFVTVHFSPHERPADRVRQLLGL